MSVEYSYDKESDSLYIKVKEGAEEEFEEVVPGINVELDSDGEVIGIEILGASRFIGEEDVLKAEKV